MPGIYAPHCRADVMRLTKDLQKTGHSRDLSHSQRRKLVERAGLEPASPACKAGALPIELSSHGAWSWFRANLSAFSARRCHQISFPGSLS
jgi:hypothetical protein